MLKKLISPKFLLLGILILASLLRLWKISVNPVSLFGDELDLGYQAYSILKTGRDYYGNFMPIHFHSLAEWRTPLYLYSAVPTVAIFGISPLGVRLPAAIFGILSVYAFYLLVKKLSGDENLALVSSLMMAINPWHLQYSRAGFEVTELLFFLILGLYLFLKSFEEGKYLWMSMVCFCLTPYIYSTAKLFTPILLAFLIIFWRKEILSIKKKYLIQSAIALLIVGLPIAFSTIFGGGAQRFSYISVFTNPVTEPEVGTARLNDARARGETGTGLNPTLLDRTIHNKFTFWGQNIIRNYLQPFSTEFLFIKGDPNLRHSIGVGEFYKIDLAILLVGIVFYFTSKKVDLRQKILIGFWVLAGIIPSAITRDGGNHATRLIIILPALLFLIAHGFVGLNKYLKVGYVTIILLSFFVYLHAYYAHYPFESERWWHYGFGPAFSEIKKIDKDYDSIVISTSNEPPWVFFAGWYMYDPSSWQKEFPIGNDVELKGFGKVSHTGKYYFGSPSAGIYSLGGIMEDKTLYLAVAKEVGANLILEPERVPAGLKLLKAIPFPSGEPAYYIFSK